MLSQKNFDDLEKKGYTVVNGVLSATESAELRSQFEKWAGQFIDREWPKSANSLIQTFNVGHLEAAWRARLKAKPVFAEIWKTEKLLTSFDAVAIGRPPEEGQEKFQDPDVHWLHLDQSSRRIGLHAYQGGVYLEEACEDDWTFSVLEGSHTFLQEFYDNNPKAGSRSASNEFYRLKPKEVKFFEGKGCEMKRVPVPCGGMALWDSRLVHANARPVDGRQNPGRWRYVVFVSMTPANWASDKDLQKKNGAYRNARMTTHWSSQGVGFFGEMNPKRAPTIWYPTEVPGVAKTREAKQLAGLISYDFEDGQPNGPELPKWKESVSAVEG